MTYLTCTLPRCCWRWMPGSRSSASWIRTGLPTKVALESDEPDITRHLREDALIRTITHMIDLHHWNFSWDARGLRLTHDAHTFVLGVPAVFLEYLQDSPAD